MHRGPPVLGGARVAPVLLSGLDGPLQRLGDSRYLGRSQVAALLDSAAVLHALGPCFREGDDRVVAQPDHRWFAVDVQALAPGLGQPAVAGGSHQQAQPISASAVSVPSRLVDSAHEGGAERRGSVHYYALHYYFLRGTGGC